MRSSSFSLIIFFRNRSCFDNSDINFESNISGQEKGNMLTVFFLLGDLFRGLSDGSLVLGVRVSMFSFVGRFFLVVRFYLFGHFFQDVKICKKSFILQDESQSFVRE